MKIHQFSKIVCCVFLLLSITTLIQPVQSKPVMDKIDQIKVIKEEINKHLYLLKKMVKILD